MTNLVEHANRLVVRGAVADGEEGVHVGEVEAEVVDVDGVARGDGEAGLELGGGRGARAKGRALDVARRHGRDVGRAFRRRHRAALNRAFDDEGHDEEWRLARRRPRAGERARCFRAISLALERLRRGEQTPFEVAAVARSDGGVRLPRLEPVAIFFARIRESVR